MSVLRSKNYTGDQLLLSHNILFLPYDIINLARPPTLFTRLYDRLLQLINREYTTDLKSKLFVALHTLPDHRLGLLLMRIDNVSPDSSQDHLHFYYKPIDRLWRNLLGWPNPLQLRIAHLRLPIPANPHTEILLLAFNTTLGPAALPPHPDPHIPRKIFQIWDDSPFASFPPIIQKSISTYRTLNPHYQHFSFGHHSAAQYIANHESPRVLHAYHLLRPLAYKADLWRYIVLYHQGGVYADAKSIALAPLDVWLPIHGGLLVNDIRGAGILNALMAMPPRDPLMRLAIDQIVTNVEARFYGNSPLDITGPRLLASCLHRLLASCLDRPQTCPSYTRLQFDNTGILIRDPTRDLVVASQHNGEYRRSLSRPGMPHHYEEFWLNRTVYGEDPKSDTSTFRPHPSTYNALPSAACIPYLIPILVLFIALFFYYRHYTALAPRKAPQARHDHQN